MDITAYLKKLPITFTKKKHRSLDIVRDPVKVWGQIVVSFAILFVIVILANVYLFNEVISGRYGQFQPSTTSADAVNSASLKNVIDYYDDRDKRFEELKTTKPAVVDPSN